MTAEDYLAGLYAVRLENIERLVHAKSLTYTSFAQAIGRHYSMVSQLRVKNIVPHENLMRSIEDRFGYEFDAMDREDFVP